MSTKPSFLIDFHQIDAKLNNMMDYMNNFVSSILNQVPNPNQILGESVADDYNSHKPMHLPIVREYGGVKKN